MSQFGYFGYGVFYTRVIGLRLIDMNLPDWIQALAKSCAKWNCVNDSNNLHKPWNFFMNERCGMSKNRSV